jgi:phage gp46-like protein
MTQQGDVLLFQTNDDGDITVVNGVVDMTGGFETAAYLSLFGGNDDDDGRPENSEKWWGNLSEIDPAFQYTSRTQNILKAIPSTSANLKRIEDAVKEDLQWFLDKGIASLIEVAVSIPALNRVRIDINISAEGEESSFSFTLNWKAMAN